MTIDARNLVSPRASASTSGRRVAVWGFIALVGIATLIWVPLLKGAGQSTPPPPVVTVGARQTTISSEPSSPYVRQDEPEMFARWGRAGVSHINRLRIAAAEKVAKAGRCDSVLTADLDDRGSASKGRPIIYVDCADNQRFILTEADLKNPLQSEAEKGSRWDRQSAVDLCTTAVQRRLNIPASLSRDLFGTSAFQAEITGRWVVDFDFHARTGLGIKVPAAAHCIIMTDGRPEVRIGLK